MRLFSAFAVMAVLLLVSAVAVALASAQWTHSWDNIGAAAFTDFQAPDMLTQDQIEVCLWFVRL